MHLCLLGPADLSATSAPSSSPRTARAHALSSPRRAVSQPEAAESAGVWSPSNEGLVVAVSSSGWGVDGERANVASVSPAFAGTALEALEALTLAVVLSLAHALPRACILRYTCKVPSKGPVVQVTSQLGHFRDRLKTTSTLSSSLLRINPPPPQLR